MRPGGSVAHPDGDPAKGGLDAAQSATSEGHTGQTAVDSAGVQKVINTAELNGTLHVLGTATVRDESLEKVAAGGEVPSGEERDNQLDS